MNYYNYTTTGKGDAVKHYLAAQVQDVENLKTMIFFWSPKF